MLNHSMKSQMSKQHGMEMFQSNDEAHLRAMDKMKELMQTQEPWKNGLKTKEKNLKLYQTLNKRSYAKFKTREKQINSHNKSMRSNHLVATPLGGG